MFKIGSDWNPKQAQLKEIILNPNEFDQATRLCLELHSIVHCSNISSGKSPIFLDEIWEGMTKEAFTVMPTAKDVTIAWNIWHITRIEDITANILIQETGQILSDEWLRRLNVSVRDTGNAMTDDEILSFSRSVDMAELKNYRNAVGMKTKNILGGLSPSDMKRKVKRENIDRILAEGGVTEHKDSVWLLDFWGKKNIAGILLMPITRHQIGHLNDSMRLKNKIMK